MNQFELEDFIFQILENESISAHFFFNREFEASYRLSFYISLLSARDRRKMQNMKNQADWLLHNIIPNHVTSKKTFTKALPQDYSENHRDIGVVFANLVNFNELGRKRSAHQ